MPYSTWVRMDVLCILGALSNGLYASDGVVVIDQSSVAAGNVTPGDAPGFPATLSVLGSYRLASNLILNQPNVSAIDITADNVALDLNGYGMIGLCKDTFNALPVCPSAGNGSGIQAIANSSGGPRSVKVLNGSGFIVNGSVIEGSAEGNGFDGIRALIVRDSMAVHNGDHGLFIDFGGVATGNVVSHNGGRGIFARSSTVIGNTVTNSGNIGILATWASSIVNNTSLGNVGAPLATDFAGCALVNNATSQ